MHQECSHLERDPVVHIYADGIFDLFHHGHAQAFKRAKALFPRSHLTVGVASDEDTHRLKGPTVMTCRERAESVRACRWVDAVIEGAPWVISPKWMDAHGLDYVVHDEAPYPGEGVADVYAEVKAAGRFIPVPRTEGISTTDLIQRILDNAEVFRQRNQKRQA